MAILTSEMNSINNIIKKLIEQNKEQFEELEKLEEQASNEIKKGFQEIFTFSRSDDENGNPKLYLNLHLGNNIKSSSNIAEIDILNKRLKTFRGGKKIKYILNGEKVSLLHNNKKIQRSIYVKENGKVKYCKINKEYILLSKIKNI